MQVTWLGQAGLLFEAGNRKILIDPYLSDSVAKIESQNCRRVRVDERFLRIKPDVVIITHKHADHLDKETLVHYLNKDSEVIVLAPNGAWQEIRKLGGLKNNYVIFNDGTTWREEYACFRAVKAEHSDENAIGCVLSLNGENYYVTGDTLYSERVFASLPDVPLKAVFLPVNGKGNNMNFIDATAFAKRVGAKYSVPLHFGRFDALSAENWACENKRILPLYEKVEF